MHSVAIGFGFVSLLLSGGIFGFFYAWVCSTMWGLDAADPRVAIEAMRAMNASVRNGVFAVSFFGTPIALFATAAVAYFSGYPRASALFGSAALIYLIGGFGLTMQVNVPMNEALAAATVPDDLETAQAMWQDYSPRWQVYNTARTVVCGVVLLVVGAGLLQLRSAPTI